MLISPLSGLYLRSPASSPDPYFQHPTGNTRYRELGDLIITLMKDDMELNLEVSEGTGELGGYKIEGGRIYKIYFIGKVVVNE